MKMRPHLAAHPQQPLIRKYPHPPGKLTGSFHCMSKCTSFLPDILEIIPFKLFLFPLFDRISRDSTLSLAVFKKSRSEIIVAKKRRRGQIVLQHSWTNETMRSHVSALQRVQWSWFLEFASVASRYHSLTRQLGLVTECACTVRGCTSWDEFQLNEKMNRKVTCLYNPIKKYKCHAYLLFC